LYIYDGKFQTDNYLHYGFNNDKYNSIELYFWTNSSNYIKYGIVPEKSYTNQTDFFLDYNNISLKYEVARNGNKEHNSVSIKFTDNGECIGCNIANSSQIANSLNKEVLEEKQRKLAVKVNRAKSFVGHFIQGTYLAYVSNYNSENGCISAKIFPYKVTKKGEYPQKFHDDCSHENYKIIPNARACPNCNGWGTEEVTVLHTTTYYTTDNAGNRTYDKSPSRSGYVSETHSCSVCGGDGVIVNN
jgi:hypothetical protein